MPAGDLVARFPDLPAVAKVVPVGFRNVPSTQIAVPEQKELVLLCDRQAAEHADRHDDTPPWLE